MPGSGGVPDSGGMPGSGGVPDSGGDLGSGGGPGRGGDLGSGGVSGNGGISGSGGTIPGPADVRADVPEDKPAGSDGSDGSDSADGPEKADVSDTPAACSGVADSHICWYLGRSGDSCATTCATHGGTAAQAASHVGNASQGGSADECARLFGLLGATGSVLTGTRSDGQGLGCCALPGMHVYLTSPPYSDSAKYGGIQVVCGCVR
jgi:hypothetical protein